MHKLASETYVNRDSTKVVPKGSVDAAYLLGMADDEISDETAVRLGLVGGSADDAPAGYAKSTVPQLKALLEERGVDVPKDAKKPDLVAAAEEYDRVAAEDEAAKLASSSGTADQGEAEAVDGTKQADSIAEA